MAEPDWPHHCGDVWRAHVLERTGADITEVTGPSPRRAREWVATMRRLQVRDFAGVVTIVHGLPLASTKLARRGDLALRGWALGIVRGEAVEFYGGVMVPLRQVDLVWRISAR